MTGRVAIVVRCADCVRGVYPTVERARQPSISAPQVVIVTDPSTPAAAKPWIREFAAHHKVTVVDAADAQPGAVRNAGIRATTAPYIVCVDAGDRLDPRFIEAAASRLDGNPSVGIVTGRVHEIGPDSLDGSDREASVDLDLLIGDVDAIPAEAMFRRASWQALGGFDPALPALAAYEFWIRVLAGGAAVAALDHPIVSRVLAGDALYRREWDRDRYVAALTAIVAKHINVFGRDPARALYARERCLQHFGDRYRHLMARRDAGVAALRSLNTQAAQLREALPESERYAVDFGDLKRTTPIARDWGYERGRPVDRHYIEQFLDRHASDIAGVVLEIQEPDYTKRFGADRITRSDVLDLNPSNPRATVVADLRNAANIPADTYDCIILTQTLHVVDDMRSVLSECRRILRPGGVLLVTLPAASRVCLEYGTDGDFWRVTEAGARKLFADVFPTDAIEVEAHGNVLVNTAFLYGLACHELGDADFDAADPYFPALVTVRARKPAEHLPSTVRNRGHHAARETSPGRAAILLYHRVARPPSDVHHLAVDPDVFEAHVGHLARHYRPMTLDALAAAVARGEVPDRAVAVTFDDGYVDNYAVASPLLSAAGVPATFFVTTDRLNDRAYQYWWDVLEECLLVGRGPERLDIELPDGARSFDAATDEQRRAAHSAIYQEIVAAPAIARDRVIERLTAWSGRGIPAAPERRRMTADEVRDLAARDGHAIGAHTVRHLMLPRQPADSRRREIDDSRRCLEALLGRPVTTFAYPFGAVCDDTAAAVKEFSFAGAVTCEEKLSAAGVDVFRLPRFEVTPARAADFSSWLQSLFEQR